MAVDPRHTAVVLIEYQNDFTSEGGALHGAVKDVMESTGIYGIALFEGLEESGCDVKLVDTQDTRHVPGRKTDVQDCQWLQEGHTELTMRSHLMCCS